MTWQTKKLGEICDVLDSQRKPITQRDRISGEYPYYGATGVQDYVKDYIFDEKLILIGEDGAKWGAGENTAFVVEGKYWVNNHAHVIKPHRDNVLDNWIVYFLNVNDLSKHITGLTVQKLNQAKLREIELPLPPVYEQKRLIKILDEAFDKISIVKVNAEKNLRNTRELFESYLQNIFAKTSEEWISKRLGEVTSKIGSGATPRGGKSSYCTEGISLVRSMNVHDRKFKEKNLAFINTEQANDLNNVTLIKGDVLLNITGASVTRSCVFPEKYLPARVNQHVSIIRPQAKVINTFFLNYLLTSKVYKDILIKIGEQGATRQAITKTQLENLLIVFPPSIQEQETIVKKLDLLSEQVKKLEANYKQKIADIDELKKSLLTKAFAGEL